MADHGFGWEQLREIPMLDLAPGDTWVQPAIGSTWSAGPDGRVAGWDHSWYTRPPRGRALTVLSRDGDVITIRSHEGEQKTVTIPRDRDAEVLLVDQLGEQRRGWIARTEGAAPAFGASGAAPATVTEVGSHTAALAYTAAMSTAAADTAASLASSIAAMGRRQVGADAVGHLAAARDQAAVMAAALASAHQVLAGHTVVGEAYAAAPDAGDKTWMSDDAPGSQGAPEKREVPMTAAATAPAGDDPNRMPAAVVDVLGYADGDTCHGTDQVTSAAGPATTLALMNYGEGNNRWDGGQYVAVSTSPGRWNPVTSTEDPAGDAYAKPGIYQPPHLDSAEAEAAARHLDELADLAEAGHRPPKLTKWGRAAQRLEHLVAGDADLAREKVMIGDDELPVTVRDLLTLLRDKQPAAGPATRRHVAASAIDQAGGDTGALWMDLVDHDGVARVAVAGVEGTEDPGGEYWRPYTAQHTPAQARELAGKLRTFAAGAREQQAAIDIGGEDRHQLPTGSSPADSAPAAPAGPRRVTNPEGKQFEYDPDTATTAVIESDGWRAVVPPSSPTGIAARLLYWNAEIKDGRGDDATDVAARALLDGRSVKELQEIAAEIGTTAYGARTRAKLIEHIVTTSVSAARKFRGLRRW